ncbi:MAG: hypothetical protein ACYTFG_10490 [Planctomycetota bacterium]|jgi:hypothetical protein
MAKKKTQKKGGIEGSVHAKRTAHAVLEVLSGLKGPSEGAETLSVSLPQYYLLETRGLEGLVKALEPRGKGKRTPSLLSRLETTERERDRLKGELDRMRSLVRLTQRAVGLSTKPGKTKGADPEGKGKKKVRRGKRKRNVLARLLPESGEGASKISKAPRAAEPQ